MSKMKLSELIKLYHDHEEERISKDEFIKVLNSVFVQGYLPLTSKIANVIKVLFGCNYSEDRLDKYLELEMNKFWYIMMPYVNIEIEEEFINNDNYELLFPTMSVAIEKYAKKDIDVALKILDDVVLDMRHEEMISVFKDLAGTSFEELIKADNKLVNELNNNPEFISNLVQLFNHVDPNMGKINKKISESIIQKDK